MSPIWPRCRRRGFADAARKAVGAVLVRALPMRPSTEVVGVLTTYHRDARAVVDPDDAQFLSDAIGAALLRDPWSTGGDFRTGPWATRSGIHQATGMVIAQLRIDPADALALLRAHAFAENTSLAEVAERIVKRQLAFTDPDGDEN